MKILRIITRLNTGGPAIQAIDLTRELIKRGHDCFLITGKVPNNEGADLEQYAFDKFSENEIQYCHHLQRGLSLRKDLFVFLELRKQIKKIRPDVIHTHMAKAGFLGRLAALTVRPKPKMVHTFHGHVFHSYFSGMKSWFYLMLERWLSKRTDKIIAISNIQLVELNDLGIKNLVMIPLGFDLSRFLKIEPYTYIPMKQLHIGIIGRLTNIKNHDLFLDFIEAVSYIHPVYGWIIGDGERLDEIKQAICDRELPIEMMSYPYSRIHNLIKKLDIVVCTSKNEGTPVSLIEAMASGRLVMSTRAGGCLDLLGHARGMHLCFSSNKLDINAKLLIQYLRDGTYKGFQERARVYVNQKYQLPRLVNDIENLYERIIK